MCKEEETGEKILPSRKDLFVSDRLKRVGRGGKLEKLEKILERHAFDQGLTGATEGGSTRQPHLDRHRPRSNHGGASKRRRKKGGKEEYTIGFGVKVHGVLCNV